VKAVNIISYVKLVLTTSRNWWCAQ